MKSEEQDFNPFDDFSSDEEILNNERRTQMQSTMESKLEKLANDPVERTMQENRLVFNHRRLGAFQVPQKIQQLFSREECNAILEQCRAIRNEWTTARHSAFPTTDIPIRKEEDEDVVNNNNNKLGYLIDRLHERLFPQLASYYGFHPTRDLDFRDIFIVKYASDAQRGLKLHTDGCLMSFNVLISHQDDFQGGGTYFESIDKDVQLVQGDCVFHDARIMHRGIDITQGERYILVGFVDTVDTVIKDKRAAMLTGNKKHLRNNE
ncbi:hypothetical protein BDA99DRAFT_544158 [Phascolomyces articulosus]|uniref:Fe2OG dioxygenase domain-containing protein n=1 Tax=Phascolomyces articulosus TaxID=60185 RepID=A0AAD5JXF0_9FUNG|nr:hypothetical protein BDA99DRAFT_544158 [Phascolomyces articulosus]